MFTKEACSLMGLSKESPLSITVDAGCKALPALNSIRQVDLSSSFHFLFGIDELYPVIHHYFSPISINNLATSHCVYYEQCHVKAPMF